MLASIILLQALILVHGYPSGAPTGACEDMMPRHAGVLPQPSRPPYSLLTDGATYQPGKPVTVAIVGPVYRGVLLQARTGNMVQALGSFQNPPPDTKFLTCSGNTMSAVTHSNINLKGNMTVYSWMPPTSAPPNIYFTATVAQQRSVYWLNVRSKILTRGIPGAVALATDSTDGLLGNRVLLVLLLGSLSVLG